MKAFKYFFIIWGIVSIIGGTSRATGTKHLIAILILASACFFIAGVGHYQEKKDKELDKRKR